MRGICVFIVVTSVLCHGDMTMGHSAERWNVVMTPPCFRWITL